MLKKTSMLTSNSITTSEEFTYQNSYALRLYNSSKYTDNIMDNFQTKLSQSSNDMWRESSPEIYNTSTHSAQLLYESWWNIFDQQYLRHSLAWTIAQVIAYLLILIVGVIGNCMVILVVLLRPRMRSVTNIFIMNLAVADLFVIVFCVPATLLANLFTPWILGSFMCKGVAYVQGVSVCASAYSLAAISVDRCMAVYKPFKRPSGLSRTQALITIFLIWTIAMMLTIPWAVIFNLIPNTDGFEFCVETWENEYHGKLYFLIANFIMFYCSPMIIISISNLAIWCHVTHRKVPHDTASAAPIKKMHKKARYGVLKMLGIVTLTFLISWLPLYLIVMRMKFGENISDSEINYLQSLMPFAQWLGSWNSSINPILYAFLNNKFREMFGSFLPKWCPFMQSQGDIRMVVRRAGIRNDIGHTTGTSSNGRTSCATVSTTQSSTRCTYSVRFQNYQRQGGSRSHGTFHRNNPQGTDNERVAIGNCFELSSRSLQGNVARSTVVMSEIGIVTDL